MSQFSFYSIDMYVLRCYWSVLVAKPKGKRPLGRPRGKWVVNIKMYVRGILDGAIVCRSSAFIR
jgi:hypothetical protein